MTSFALQDRTELNWTHEKRFNPAQPQPRVLGWSPVSDRAACSTRACPTAVGAAEPLAAALCLQRPCCGTWPAARRPAPSGEALRVWFIPKQRGWCPGAGAKQKPFYSRVNIGHLLASRQPILRSPFSFPTGNVFQPLSIWLKKQLHFSSHFIWFGMDASCFHCAACLAACGSGSSSQNPGSH